MLKTLKDLFESLVPAAPGADPGDADHRLRLATAVLLVELMRADGHFHADERAAVQRALREKFALAADESERLAELAEATARSSTDLFAYTSVIDERFEMPQKVRMVELLATVAFADGTLDDHERHLLWRIADLLHVPHGAYVHARSRAQRRES